VFIEPIRVSAIQTFSLPRNKKEIQTFLGKINFLRRFIPNYVEIVKDITDMLRKYHEVKWTIPTITKFDHIRKVISEAPILASPNYSEPFNIFSFASKTTLVVFFYKRMRMETTNLLPFSVKL